MKILFTGSSSFTGMWFIQELVSQGHDVTALFQKEASHYADKRKERVDRAIRSATPVFNCSFGTPSFLRLLDEKGPWDLLCHHAADVTNYKSLDFNASNALANNTFNIKNVIDALKKNGCSKILLTGSVFEQGEGAGSSPLRAFSPYGLSKGLTTDVFQYYCETHGMRLGKFVIPNPFGPYEEKRFTSFLAETWFKRKTAPVDFPSYVRDNIHVSLLAKAYADFAVMLEDARGFQKLNPSGYPESQGSFTLRFAKELSTRLNIRCEIDMREQKQFPEPVVRINTDLLDSKKLGWNESAAWDDLATYYDRIFSKVSASSLS